MVAISLDLILNFVSLGLENCAFIVELELGVIKAYGEWCNLIANLELEPHNQLELEFKILTWFCFMQQVKA